MVVNILKDGTVKKDMTGHIVKMSDCPELYEVIKSIERRLSNEHKRGR